VNFQVQFSQQWLDGGITYPPGRPFVIAPATKQRAQAAGVLSWVHPTSDPVTPADQIK
jgi:hypothetical protein